MARSPEKIDPEVTYAGEIPYTTMRVDKDGTFMAPAGCPVGIVGNQGGQYIFVVCLLPCATCEQVEACVRSERSLLHKRRVRVEGRKRKREHRLTKRSKPE